MDESRDRTSRRLRTGGVVGALVALVFVAATACGGETRIEQGLDAGQQAAEQGRVIEENQQRIEDVAGLTPDS
jgi:hypothetical protein